MSPEGEHNPYAPSEGTLNAGAPTVDDTPLELASQSRRFLNFLIDIAGYLLFSLLIGILLGLLSLATGLDKITRTRVVNESGAPAKWWQLLLRTLFRFMPFDGFSFLSRQRPGWHDRWSNTRVIMDRR